VPASPTAPSGLGGIGSGTPLHDSDRAFFEPRFGQSFSDVRIHSGGEASRAAQSVSARAFTLGHAIVMGEGTYAPGTRAGRALLAHELTHVVQQDAGGEQIVRRKPIDTDCKDHRQELQDGWDKGLLITEQTIASLDTAYQAITYLGSVPPYLATPITNAFGDDVGLVPGTTKLKSLSGRYEKIKAAFESGRKLRCDLTGVGLDQDECKQYDAFVIPGNHKDVFICPSFESGKTVAGRGVTFIHELAHDVFGIKHAGGVVQQFDCNAALGLEYDVAVRNAYAYDILANCLHGEGSTGSEYTAPPPAARATAQQAPRWSLSGSLGAGVTPGATRFAATLGSQVSLRTGEYVVFNPTIGFNLLYLSPGADNPASLAAATADIGLRIQQPLKGLYFDVSAGGYAGFDINGGRDPSAQFTGGPTAAAGVGWRSQRFELGVRARALVPETDFDRTQLVVFGHGAVLFP